MKKKRKCVLFMWGCLFVDIAMAQNIDIETIKKTPKIKVNGTINANTVYYTANKRNARVPFTYFLQGTLNIHWLGFSVPFSYRLTNQGDNFNYQLPFKFNRLSLHPKYKWVQAHIGDVAMTFSPYTLNAHQFTGVGIEVTPNKGTIDFSAMYGRLLKATQNDGNSNTLPTFKRIGYGAKIDWKKERYKLILIGFYAKDIVNSIKPIPEEKNIKPKENLVISLSGETTIAQKYTLKTEYASTAITQDTRALQSATTPRSLAGLLFNNKLSTAYYNAFKAALDMKLGAMKVGVGYERIDPNYQTLGAYYFNNDFENITLNAARSLFRNRLSVAFNIGYQRDNLNNQKKQSTGRNVGSVNASYQITKDVVLTGAYSNFTTFTNKRLNQFDEINDHDLTNQEAEALNFKQLSQNANLNLNWQLAKKEHITQDMSIGYSLASSANKENNIIRVGQANNFHNANAIYTIGFPKKSLVISPSLNYNYSDIGREDSQAWGASLNINTMFFKNKLNSILGTSYNTNQNKEITTNVFNIRAMVSTVLAKKHQLNLNAIQLFRSSTTKDLLKEFTMTFGYSYAFDIKKPKLKIGRKKGDKKTKEFSFSYKTHTFKGEHSNITRSIKEISNAKEFLDIKSIKRIQHDLSLLEIDIKNNEDASHKKYKKAVIHYLAYLYKHKNFTDTYHQLAFKSLKELYKQAGLLDAQVKSDYVRLVSLTNEKGGVEFISEVDKRNLKIRMLKMKSHEWMKSELEKLTYQDIIKSEGILKEFEKKYLDTIFVMIEGNKTREEIAAYLSLAFAKFYHKKALLILRKE
ncbi:conserved exported hypothetical protein [Tenacibaculum maritimum]|uniref:hypothetical protein n=1 Tax=Tenacibaculum maritimum TaxID=107401 RepID=UPI0012E6307C|nr:hypothetical protein [Tenacibaculum maritimum]CAA0243771.1 conserved exported hypothetical protein [Tenacibaculum maritimum]